MRTINANTLAKQVDQAVAPRFTLRARREHLAFADFAANSVGSLDTGVPQNYVARSSGGSFYTVFRKTDGTVQLRIGTLATAGDWALTGTSLQIAAGTDARPMRYGWLKDSDPWLYTCYADGSALRIRRAQVTDTNNPLTYSPANWGPTFGAAPTETATLLRRVEAVIPMDSSTAFVVTGNHNLNTKRSTIQFWMVTASAAVQLKSRIEVDTTGQPYTSWHQSHKWASFCGGVKLGANDFFLFANAHQAGRGVFFTVHNGIESPVQPFVHVDPATGNSLALSSVEPINGVLYACGRFAQTATDGQVTAFDCLLKSVDGRAWSFGDHDFLLGETACHGALLIEPDLAPVYLYYGGNGTAWRAQTTDVLLASETRYTDLDSYVESITLDQASGAADQLDITLGATQSELQSVADVAIGATLRLRAGQGEDLDTVGWYVVDDVDGQGWDEDGRPALKLTARDQASRRLIEHNIPADVDIVGIEAICDDLTDLEGVILKSPESDSLRANANERLRFDGLNEPAILWLDNIDARTGIVKTTVQLATANDYRLPIVGFVVGAGDAGDFRTVLIPGANSWTGSPKAKPELRQSSLGAVDPTEPDKVGTGYNFEPGMAAVWVQQGETTLITAAVTGGTYRVNPDYTIPIGAKTDLVCRVWGRGLQVWAKAQNYAPASAASNADYSLVVDFTWGPSQASFDVTKNRFGLLLAQDVFASKTAFEGAFYDDVELSINEAALQKDPAAGVYNTAITGTVVGFVHNPGVVNGAEVQGTGTLFTTQLRVGQKLRVASAVREIATITSDTLMHMTDTGGWPTSPSTAYIKSGEYYAWASSRIVNKPFGDDDHVYLDPGADKKAVLLAGDALIIDNATNTAKSHRKVVSDGVDHYLADAGWDATNPIPDPGAGNSGSKPGDWRIIFHHGRIAAVPASTYGLPTSGYMKVDDEVVKYEEVSFTKWAENLSSTSYAQTATWLTVPTIYALADGQTVPSSTINGGFGVSGIAAGMLVQVSARNTQKAGYFTRKSRAESPQQILQIYVVSRVIGSPSYITVGRYDEPFGTLATATPSYVVSDRDVVVMSGRGAFGTDKVSHDTDTPVCFYPCDANGHASSISVHNLDAYSGSYVSVEDALKRVCATAGVFAATGRNLWTTGAGADISSSSNSYTFPTGNVANFVLDLLAHLPGNSTDGSGAYLNENRLNVSFRNYYRLVIRQLNSATDMQNGRFGSVAVGLQTTSTDISPNASGERWLEQIIVPVTDASLSGAYSAAHPAYTLTTDVSMRCRIRLAVQDHLASVELNGQLIAVFNLKRYTDGTNSYFRTTASSVSMSYTTGLTGHTWSAHMAELHQPVDRLVVPMGTQASSGVSSIARDRRLRWRATADGGVEFGRFLARDDLGTFVENIFTDIGKRTGADLTTHAQIAGPTKVGAAVNVAAARAYGYRFAAGGNSLANTSEDAITEAGLVLADELQQVEQRSVTSVGFLQIQPEDRLRMLYDARNISRFADGDVPHTDAGYVVEHAKLAFSEQACEMSMTLRLEAIP